MVETIIKKRKYDASEITQFFADQTSIVQPMLDRMEEDYSQWAMDEIDQTDAEKGEFERYIGNKPRVFADKVIEELSSGKVKFTIPIFKDKGKRGEKSEREACSMTEQAVYGLLRMADNLLVSDPFSTNSQSLMAWYGTMGRYVILRFRMYEETERGEKVVVPDLAVWDGYNTRWTTKRRGIGRVCYKRYASIEDIEDQYEKTDVAHDERGRVVVYDHWDEEREAVVVGSEIVHFVEHKLGYVPVGIFASGSAPLVQHEAFDINLIRHVNESVLARSRRVWKEEDEFNSYVKTQAKLGIDQILKVKYDSSKGGRPPEFTGDPRKTGSEIILDEGKGEDVEPLLPGPLSQQIMVMLDKVGNQASLGSAPDIFYGRQETQTTAQGTAMLIHAAMTALKSGIRQIEQGYTWFANEAIRQYKAGKWKDIQVQGVDHAEAQFAVAIERDKLVTDRRIEASLNIETPQDELENIGKAIELDKSDLVSKQTIRDRLLHVADTDAEESKVLMEKIGATEFVALRRAQKEFIEAGDFDAADAVGLLLEAVKQRIISQMTPPAPPQGAPGGAGIPGAMPAGALPGRAVGEAMPSVNYREGMRFGAGRPEGG